VLDHAARQHVGSFLRFRQQRKVKADLSLDERRRREPGARFPRTHPRDWTDFRDDAIAMATLPCPQLAHAATRRAHADFTVRRRRRVSASIGGGNRSQRRDWREEPQREKDEDVARSETAGDEQQPPVRRSSAPRSDRMAALRQRTTDRDFESCGGTISSYSHSRRRGKNATSSTCIAGGPFVNEAATSHLR
jgi:hypothetical protein